MTAQEFQDVNDRIETEGSVEYTFVHYSNFEEIKDEKFHELRKAFVKAYEELTKYIGYNN